MFLHNLLSTSLLPLEGQGLLIMHVIMLTVLALKVPLFG